MSDLHAGFYSTLTADGTVSGLVSTRVYPDIAPPDATLPYIVLSEVTDVGYYHSAGISDIADPFYQVALWASSSTGRATLKAAVRSCLERRAGLLGSSGIRSITLESSIDVAERQEGGDEAIDFGAIQTWRCWVKP